MRCPSLVAIVPLGLALAACGAGDSPLVPPVAPVQLVVAPSPPLRSIEEDATAASRIAADVSYLASPELAGRGTGEPGARLAATFVAKRFAELGLAPAGDPTADPVARYFQAFTTRVGATVKRAELDLRRGGASAATTVSNGATLHAADGASSGEATGKAVFVGYGIAAPAASWDDYAGADLAGAVAVILDGVPGPGPGVGPNPLRDFDRVRYKLRTAREHHAAGAIIVHEEGELAAEQPLDTSNMGIPAVVVTAAQADVLFPRLRLKAKTTWHLAKALHLARVPAGASPPVTVRTEVVPVEAQAWNVVGRLAAKEGSPHAGEVLVVGAHYDHLGHGGPFSLAPGDRSIHPGADDNASGAALLLEVARRLSGIPSGLDRSVVFVAFGAEEIGAIGSRYWVQHPAAPIERIVAMINADMVGRLRDDKLVVDGVGTSLGWRPLVESAANGLGLQLAFGAEGFGASDHASFTAVRVPVAFFFTGAHADYHKPTDTADKINAPGEARVATLAARLALAVADAPDRLAFVDAPADPHQGSRGGFKVSLGTVPDYAFAGKGVRLDGVRPDAPAARAGLTRGDVIVKVAGHEVGNIHDYMFALGELQAGVEAVIEVERDGKRLALKVVPAPGR